MGYDEEMETTASRFLGRWALSLALVWGSFLVGDFGGPLHVESVMAAETADAGPRTLSDLAYGEGRRTADAQRRLDLYLPRRGQVAPPLFVYIHGGAWVSGDKGQYGPVGGLLREQGIAVAIINYRLSDGSADGVRHPAHAQDAAQAVAFLRKRAAQYGYDANRIFVGGHSAGAHISALLAFDPSLLAAVGEKPDALRGFVGLEGIYDLGELVRRFPGYRVDFLQAAFGSDESSWQKASPINLLSPSAVKRPWLLIHTRSDELVDFEQSRMFQKALERNSVPVRFTTPDRGSHFSVIGELILAQSSLCQQLLAFLRG